jgi:ATP-dependent DNA helicase RecG
MAGFFDTSIEFLKGIGPQRAAILNKELNIFTFGDLIQYYPFRHEDRTKFYKIAELGDDLPHVQVTGFIKRRELIGAGYKRRLVADLSDGTGTLELVWFQGIKWAAEKI